MTASTLVHRFTGPAPDPQPGSSGAGHVEHGRALDRVVGDREQASLASSSGYVVDVAADPVSAASAMNSTASGG